MSGPALLLCWLRVVGAAKGRSTRPGRKEGAGVGQTKGKSPRLCSREAVVGKRQATGIVLPKQELNMPQIRRFPVLAAESTFLGWDPGSRACTVC